MEFAPPPTPGLARALILALVAHAVLLGGLALAVQWKRGSIPVTVEAELWAELPTDATAPPTTQTALQPAPAAALVPNDGGTTLVVAPEVGMDSDRKPALQQKEKQLHDSQLEQEKRRREALKQNPPELEMETDTTDEDGKPSRDPT
jgi:colicin import membrane protein